MIRRPSGRNAARAKAPSPHPGGHEGEDSDPACGNALDKGERRERERGDVERKAATLERKADQPAAIGQERLH